MFKPVNRHILVSVFKTEEPTTDSGIVLPDDFKPTKERYTVVTVDDWAEDVKFASVLNINSQLVIDNSMLEEISIDGQVHNLILDNYVVGIL